MNKSPEAIFDILYIGSHLQTKLEDFNLNEIQFMAYLSCLISLYDKNPIAFWKYKFIKNDYSSPYSVELHSSLNFLQKNSYINETTENYYQLTERGYSNLGFYDSLSSFKNRKKYLQIACNSLSIIPINIVKEAIRKEPIMKSAFHNPGKRFLLDKETPAMIALYNDFFNLHIAMNDDYNDLLAPAVVWLQSLSTKNPTIND